MVLWVLGRKTCLSSYKKYRIPNELTQPIAKLEPRKTALYPQAPRQCPRCYSQPCSIPSPVPTRAHRCSRFLGRTRHQFAQLEKAIHELNALASKWIDLRGEAEHYMRVELGGGGLSDGDWPVTDIRNRTARWISDRELRKQMMRMMQAAKDKENS